MFIQPRHDLDEIAGVVAVVELVLRPSAAAIRVGRKCRRAGSRDLHSLRPTVTTPKGAVASRDTPAIRSGAHPINNIGHVLPDRRRRSRRRARVGEASALDIGR